MPPKKDAAKKEAPEESEELRIVGPGELDDNGQPRPQDVLELVSNKMKLDQSTRNRERMEDENKQLRDELQRQSGEQTEIFAYLNKELRCLQPTSLPHLILFYYPSSSAVDTTSSAHSSSAKHRQAY